MQTAFQEASNLLSQGNVEKAEQILRKILQSNPKNEECLALLGHSLMMQARSDEALLVFKKIIKYHPHSAPAFAELASVYVSKGLSDDAERSFQRALELKPTYSEAWHLLGNLLMQRGERLKAKDCFIRAERCDPYRDQFKKVQQLLQQEQFHQAEQICREVLSRHKTHPQALYTLAILAEQTKAYEEALKILSHGLKYSPFHINLLEKLVKNFGHTGHFDKAIEAARRLLAIEPNHTKYIMILARELVGVGRNEESLSFYDKAVSLEPDVANVHLQRGHVLKSMGRRADCEAAYQKSIELEKINGAAFWALADLKSHRFSDTDRKRMQSILENKDTTPAQASQAGFALAKSYEDVDDYQTAFNYYERANKLKPDTYYNPDDINNACDVLQKSFSQQSLEHHANPIPNGPTPIFIVGLTRSGSTLIEQILASHSSIEGTMELYSIPRTVRRAEMLCTNKGMHYPQSMAKLSPQELNHLGQSYLDETAIYRTGKPYFIDKMPANFLNVGLIHMILPNALIIDARRHPLATGFSNYKQHFAKGYDFSYDLSHIGHYFNSYLKVMDHWNKLLPNKVLCVQYENMVRNTEQQVRQILNHCGLAFEDQCLKFYQNKRSVRTASSEQVRQPINTKGLQQWRHFETYLTPLKEALGKETLQRFAPWS